MLPMSGLRACHQTLACTKCKQIRRISIQPWWLGSLGRYSCTQLKSTFWRSVDQILLVANNMVANAPAVYVRWNCNMYICKL